jgi:hypothetical protein
MVRLSTLLAKRKSAMSDDDISGVHEYHLPHGGWGATAVSWEATGRRVCSSANRGRRDRWIGMKRLTGRLQHS